MQAERCLRPTMLRQLQSSFISSRPSPQLLRARLFSSKCTTLTHSSPSTPPACLTAPAPTRYYYGLQPKLPMPHRRAQRLSTSTTAYTAAPASPASEHQQHATTAGAGTADPGSPAAAPTAAQPEAFAHDADAGAASRARGPLDDRPPRPAYALTFTCKPCGARSSHEISKQGYHDGTVLITCPGCKNRHIISDHLGIFADQRVTIEDIMKDKGEIVRKGRLRIRQGKQDYESGTDGDVEFYKEADAEEQRGATQA